MRNLMNIATASAAAALMAANTGAGTGNSTSELKKYLVTAGPRNSKEAGSEKDQVQFMITADSYKKAWELGREVTRTGSRDFIEEYHTDDTVVISGADGDDKVPTIKAGTLSVKNVASLQDRRKAQPLTVEKLLEICDERKVSVPKALRDLIDELQASGPAAPAAAAAAPEGEAATA